MRSIEKLALRGQVDGSYVQRNAKRKRYLQYALPLLFYDGRNGSRGKRGTGTIGMPPRLSGESALGASCSQVRQRDPGFPQLAGFHLSVRTPEGDGAVTGGLLWPPEIFL